MMAVPEPLEAVWTFQNVSPRRAAASLVLFIGPLERGVEATGADVLLDLAVPVVGHETFEPLRKTSDMSSAAGRPETADSSSSMLMRSQRG
jgi:hypothetical protein